MNIKIRNAFTAISTANLALVAKKYGSSSSLDWATKDTALLCVRAVIVESYELIHRPSLIGMGVLPLQFLDEKNAETLGLSGEETLSIKDLTGIEAPTRELRVAAIDPQGQTQTLDDAVRIDTPPRITTTGMPYPVICNATIT
ncbi:aconitate hydratase 1 [Marinobacter sp. ELB17]|nr:aconitate hydratase 1 [Marinobacter sp. ELB17]